MTTTYGKWTLIGERYYERGQSLTRALCGGCNTEHVVRVDNLKRGRTLSCAACAKRGPNTGVRYYRGMTFNGATKPLSDWCEQYGITVALYRERVRHGMAPVKAMTTPNERPSSYGIGSVQSLVVGRGPAMECEDALAEIGEAVGVTGQMVGRITERALKRAQVSAVAERLVRPLWHWSDECLSGVVAFAVDHMPSATGPVRMPLGLVLRADEENPSFGAHIVLRGMPASELVRQYDLWSANERKEFDEKKLPFAS